MADDVFDIPAAISRRGETSIMHITRTRAKKHTMWVGNEETGWCEFRTAELRKLYEILDEQFGDGKLAYDKVEEE